jgi:phosphate transport system substrate-binding protein
MWSDIDPSLPAKKIEVLGPPPTSGTRDAFQELAMQGGSKAFSTLNALKKSNKSEWKRIVHTVREDGGWIDSGENDNLMVNKLIANPDAVGVFGYSFLEQNADKLKGSNVDGVAPTFENIADGEYNISRSLYFYVKHAHEGIVPGIKEFVEEFTSESAFGDEGYLVDKGLIPLFEEERDAIRTQGVSLKKLEL